MSLGSKDKDVLEFRRRYDFTKAGAVLADEFGNPLKSGLRNSEETGMSARLNVLVSNDVTRNALPLRCQPQ